MIDRRRNGGLLAAVVGSVCVVACSSAEPVSTDEGRLAAYDFQMNDPNASLSYDAEGSGVERAGQPQIASFQDSAAAACHVTLDWCDTPWISPHPAATCHSTGCDCAHAKQVCASLVQQYVEPSSDTATTAASAVIACIDLRFAPPDRRAARNSGQYESI